MTKEEFNLEVVLRPNTSKLKKAINDLKRTSITKEKKDVVTNLNFDTNKLVNKITTHFDKRTNELISAIGGRRTGKVGEIGGEITSTKLVKNVELLTSQMAKLTQVLSMKGKGTLGFDLEITGKKQQEFFRKFLASEESGIAKIFKGLNFNQQTKLLQAMTGLEQKQVGGRSVKGTGKFVFERVLGTIKAGELGTAEKRKKIVSQLGDLASTFNLSEKEADAIIKEVVAKQKEQEEKGKDKLAIEERERNELIKSLEKKINDLTKGIENGTLGTMGTLETSVNLAQVKQMMSFIQQEIPLMIKSHQLEETRPQVFKKILGKQIWSKAANIHSVSAEKGLGKFIEKLNVGGDLESVSDDFIDELIVSEEMSELIGKSQETRAKKLLYLSELYKEEGPEKKQHRRLIQKLRDINPWKDILGTTTMADIMEIRKAAETTSYKPETSLEIFAKDFKKEFSMETSLGDIQKKIEGKKPTTKKITKKKTSKKKTIIKETPKEIMEDVMENVGEITDEVIEGTIFDKIKEFEDQIEKFKSQGPLKQSWYKKATETKSEKFVFGKEIQEKIKKFSGAFTFGEEGGEFFQRVGKLSGTQTLTEQRFLEAMSEKYMAGEGSLEQIYKRLTGMTKKGTSSIAKQLGLVDPNLQAMFESGKKPRPKGAKALEKYKAGFTPLEEILDSLMTGELGFMSEMSDPELTTKASKILKGKEEALSQFGGVSVQELPIQITSMVTDILKEENKEQAKQMIDLHKSLLELISLFKEEVRIKKSEPDKITLNKLYDGYLFVLEKMKSILINPEASAEVDRLLNEEKK